MFVHGDLYCYVKYSNEPCVAGHQRPIIRWLNPKAHVDIKKMLVEGNQRGVKII